MITDQLIAIFESGNLDEFIKVVESEALTLHDDDFDAVFHFNETNTLKSLMQFGNSVMILTSLFHTRCWSKCPCFISRKR
jgi:hypothetical protein